MAIPCEMRLEDSMILENRRSLMILENRIVNIFYSVYFYQKQIPLSFVSLLLKTTSCSAFFVAVFVTVIVQEPSSVYHDILIFNVWIIRSMFKICELAFCQLNNVREY